MIGTQYWEWNIEVAEFNHIKYLKLKFVWILLGETPPITLGPYCCSLGSGFFQNLEKISTQNNLFLFEDL